jgi:serine/threonine protein kinase
MTAQEKRRSFQVLAKEATLSPLLVDAVKKLGLYQDERDFSSVELIETRLPKLTAILLELPQEHFDEIPPMEVHRLENALRLIVKGSQTFDPMNTQGPLAELKAGFNDLWQQMRSLRLLPGAPERPLSIGRSARRLERVAPRLIEGREIDCYRLETRLGQGHSAEVWKARVVRPPPGDLLDIDTAVALKVYLPFFESAQALRVHREFQVASEIDHPAIVRVHDVLLSPSRGYSFIAMDYVEGETLKKRIPSKGIASVDILAVARTLFDALRELHSRGILHRDVKAANVMVTSAIGMPMTVVLLDLGIVQIAGDQDITGTSVFMGSKHSAPPEQLEGKRLDNRADIYAVGSVLYHCYTGATMYDGEGAEAAIRRRMWEAPLKVTAKTADASDISLVAFINRCISVEPADRPSSAAECLRELDNLLAGANRPEFLSEVATGRWIHTWRRPHQPQGSEIATIEPDGTYYLNGQRTFQLRRIQYDPAAKTVRFNKVSLPENRNPGSTGLDQPEDLKIISRNELRGHVEGQPEFEIRYVRAE